MWSTLRRKLIDDRIWIWIDRSATVAVFVTVLFVFLNLHLDTRSQSSSKPPVPLPKEPVSLAGRSALGSHDARVVLMEFSDFQCPYCAQFAVGVLPEIRTRYIDAGTVRLVFRHNPLPIHPRAQAAAEAAECARRQGQFWEMHDLMFQSPTKLDDSDIIDYAGRLSLDLDVFQSCRTAKDASEIVQSDARLAASLGLTGTPQFLIGIAEPGDRARIIAAVSGARPVRDFEEAIDKALASTSSNP